MQTHSDSFVSRPRVSPLVLALPPLSAALLVALMSGCGPGLAYTSAPPEDGDCVDPACAPEPAALPPVDLSTVVWPGVPDPLPEGVPWWLNGFERGREARARHVPSFPDAYTQYTRATAIEASPMGPTVLFCNLSYSGSGGDPRPVFRSGRRARADLSVHGQLGEGVPFVASAPDNQRSLTFGAPTAGLTLGQTITLRVTDRDFIAHDSLGSVTLSYEGSFPLEGASGSLTARCVALDPADVARRRPRLLRELDLAIARLMQQLEALSAAGAATADVPRAAWPLFDESRAAFARASDWLSLADPEVQLRRARLDALIDAHEASAHEAYRSLALRIRDEPVARFSTGEQAWLLGYACDSPVGIGCALRVAIGGASVGASLRARLHGPQRASREIIARFAGSVEVPGAAPGAPRAHVFEVGVDQRGPRVRDAREAPLLLELSLRHQGEPALLFVPTDVPLL